MSLDDRLQRAIDTLGEKFNEKFRDEFTRELQSLSDDLKAQAPPPAPPPPPAPDNSAIVRLADAVRALDSAPSLSDVLHTLGTSAGNESARAGVFVIRDGELRSVKLS